MIATLAATTTVEDILARHDQARLESLNLIVSENRMSERARAPLAADIQGRYAANFYAGTGPAQEIVAATAAAASRVFDATHVNLAPVSGNMCLLAVLFGLTEVGDQVGRVHRSSRAAATRSTTRCSTGSRCRCRSPRPTGSSTCPPPWPCSTGPGRRWWCSGPPS
ncbi:MAG TPA: hypothetical protein VH479_05190 [Acidimicrobiales bacterium]